jgi:hypothetical protein
MKKASSPVVLLIVLVLLILLAVLVLQKPGEVSKSTAGGDFFLTVDSAQVDRIVIAAKGTVIELEKKGIDWFVQRPIVYRANNANVSDLLHQLKNMRVKSIVSNNPEKQSMFQVDTLNGTGVTIYQQGREAASFLVGKPANDYTNTYLRKTHSNDVAAVSGVLTTVVNRELKEWRDKTILTTPRETIVSVRYQYEKESFTIEKKDTLWMVDKDRADDGAINTLLTSLSKIEADGFLDSLTTQTMKPVAVISFAGAEVRFYKSKDGTQYHVQTSASPQWFELQAYKTDQLLKKKKELAKK